MVESCDRKPHNVSINDHMNKIVFCFAVGGSRLLLNERTLCLKTHGFKKRLRFVISCISETPLKWKNRSASIATLDLHVIKVFARMTVKLRSKGKLTLDHKLET